MTHMVKYKKLEYTYHMHRLMNRNKYLLLFVPVRSRVFHIKN